MKYSLGEKVDWNGKKDISLCPVCGKKRTMYAKRPQLDSICPDGHEWHIDLATGTVQEGPGE